LNIWKVKNYQVSKPLMDKIKPKQEGLADQILRGLFVLTIGEVLTVRKRKGGMTVRVDKPI
jgi:hypothetical protein